MTREQARREIDDIDYYLQHHTDDYSESSHTAMMMAITALEQESDEKMAMQYQEGYMDGFKKAQEIFTREGSK